MIYLLKLFHPRLDKNVIKLPHCRKQRRGKLINPLDPDSLSRAKFKSYEETAFIVHGFNGSHVDRHMRYLRDGKEIVYVLSGAVELIKMSFTSLFIEEV